MHAKLSNVSKARKADAQGKSMPPPAAAAARWFGLCLVCGFSLWCAQVCAYMCFQRGASLQERHSQTRFQKRVSQMVTVVDAAAELLHLIYY